jgi:hypothetical protein
MHASAALLLPGGAGLHVARKGGTSFAIFLLPP